MNSRLPVQWYDHLYFLIFAYILVFFALFIPLSIAIDTGGRQENNHAESLPANVRQIAPEMYWAPYSSNVDGLFLCSARNTGENAPVKGRLDIFAGYLYICEEEQTWSDKRAASIDFGHSVSRLLTDTIFLPVMFVVLALIGVYLLAYALILRSRQRGRDNRSLALELEQTQARLDSLQSRLESQDLI